MQTAFRPRTLILFVGDLFFFVFALWLSLYLRLAAQAGVFEVPSQTLFMQHLAPFSLLFVAWAIVFFIAGLYERRSIILERRAISATLLTAQVVNMVVAALFFFFIPIFGIAPKTLLFIYLAVSFLLVFFWRVVLFPLLGLQRPEPALVVGSGSEIKELVEALRTAHRAPAQVVAVIEPHASAVAHEIEAAIAKHKPGFIIADFNNPQVAGAFPALYNYLSEGIRFVDALTLYEEVFGRVPLSVIDDRWLARNISRYSHRLYDVLKRAMDIVIALPLAVISLVVYPLVALALKIQDRGEILISMPRIGEGNQTFTLHKFRSMSGNDRGEWQGGTTKLYVTRVGKVLRNLRLDEVPQLWSVLKGDLSLIGPRPEFPPAVAEYEREIPYYGVRHLVRPGLSGWAQLYHDNHPHHGTEISATREKLSYDLYYLKHRSLLLDFTIALKTIKKLMTRSGV